MTNPNEQTLECLNGLIQTCIDAEKGFRQAAEGLGEEPQVKNRFLSYAQERARFGEALAIQVIALGGEPVADGTFAGKIHRGWMDLRTALTSNDGAAILAEAERGEDAALSNYKDALETIPASSPVCETVQAQLESVRKAHDHISTLKNALAT